MSDDKGYKCQYPDCPHGGVIQPDTDFVMVGKRRMHPDCAKKSENIIKVRDLYYEKISDTVVMSQLVKVIKEIINKKNIDSDYLLFALSYCIEHDIEVNSPYGLYYIIDYRQIKEAWRNQHNKTIADKVRHQKIEVERPANTFSYKPEVVQGFGQILGGK